MPPRPIWSGTISFGLVSIPVRMVTATSSHDLRFHFVDRHDLQPVGYDKVRKDSGERVERDPPGVLPRDAGGRREAVRAARARARGDGPRRHRQGRDPQQTAPRPARIPLPEPQAEEGGEVVDLMQALRESVAHTQAARSKNAS